MLLYYNYCTVTCLTLFFKSFLCFVKAGVLTQVYSTDMFLCLALIHIFKMQLSFAS